MRRSVSKIGLAHEQRMTNRPGEIGLTLLCVRVASTLLTAVTALNALAAQPATPIPAVTRSSPAPKQLAVMQTAPGTLTGLSAANATSKREMNTDVVFTFAGTGHCKLKLDTGDGSLKVLEAELSPLTFTHTHSYGGMSSSDTFKDYTASVTPSGDCKSIGTGPFTATVRVVNPNPQSAGVPAQDNTMVVAGSGKLGIGMKPGTVMPPVVAPTVSSLAFSGGPSAIVGSPTVLTVIGTGVCKYHLSYVNLDAQGNTILKPYPMLPKSSSLQSPFPMTMTLLQSTPAGVYKWTASGVDGCTGTKDATLTVQ